MTGKGTFSIMLTGEGPDAKMINNSEMKYGNYFGEQETEEGKTSVSFPIPMPKDCLAQMMSWV